MPHDHPLALAPQRWERPLDFPPGYWKRQLPTKVLAVAATGDVAALRNLLAEHPDYLSKRGSHNRTLLWEAVRRGRLDAVRWLVEQQGAELDATGCYNGESYVQLTPYCAAVYYRRAEIADYLRAQGAQLDIFRAAYMGDQASVARELARHPELLDAEDPHDNIYYAPLLAFPIVGGHAALLADLLRRGAEVPLYSAQLLYLAARDGRIDMIELLVTHGAQIPALDSGSFVAVSDLRVMGYLLDHGAPAAQPGRNRQPPLYYLVRGDKGEHPDKIRLLLDHGAPVNARATGGRTALHAAAAAGYLRILSLLLERGADPTLRDDEGHTALSLARTGGKTAAAEFLLQRGVTR
jgi:ankyrin repeat protein